MPKPPDIFVIYNNISGDVYLINGLRKCESILKHLNKFYKLLEKPDVARSYPIEDFFSKFDFDKSKVQLGWNHSMNELSLWHKKIFNIKNRIIE